MPGTHGLAATAAVAGAAGASAIARRTVATAASGELPGAEPMSPYEVLRVPPGATAAQVREAYVQLAKQFHPDRTVHSDSVTKTEAEARFKEAQAAWYVLGDAARRREYDEHGTLAAPPSKMSPMMWAKLRMSKPEEGVLMPNWGDQEPPLWLLAWSPIVCFGASMLFMGRHDIVGNYRDARTLRSGGWACNECVTVNLPGAMTCIKCGAAYEPWMSPRK